MTVLAFHFRIHVMSGVCSDKFTRDSMQQTLVENLRYAADRLQKENIEALIEPINTSLTIPNYFLNDFNLGK